MPRVETSTIPRRFAALPALLICLVLACAGGSAEGPRTVWQSGQAQVELSYQGDVLSIVAVGDFNGWNLKTHPFINNGEGRWTCSLSLAPGRYHYLLAVETEADYAWRVDTANPERTRDAQGRELSVLVIEAAMSGDGEVR